MDIFEILIYFPFSKLIAEAFFNLKDKFLNVNFKFLSTLYPEYIALPEFVFIAKLSKIISFDAFKMFIVLLLLELLTEDIEILFNFKFRVVCAHEPT